MDTQFYYEAAENEAFLAAKARIQRLKIFYIHLFFYSIGATIYILKTYFEVNFSFLSINKINFSLMMAIWTGIIGIRAIKLYISNYFLGQQWEERKIHEIIKTNKKN